MKTVTTFLNEKGYYYLQARKKGLLKRYDLKTRLSFAKWCKKDLTENFWTELDLPTNQILVRKLVVAISYSKGVIICEPYEKMTGA